MAPELIWLWPHPPLAYVHKNYSIYIPTVLHVIYKNVCPPTVRRGEEPRVRHYLLPNVVL